MAKFYGAVGYGTTVETAPGVHTTQIIERTYYGDLIRNSKSTETVDQVNNNVNVSNEISILADPYALNNFHSMQYVTFMGTKWTIKSVNVVYPRLLLTIGGVYNGQ